MLESLLILGFAITLWLGLTLGGWWLASTMRRMRRPTR